MKNDDRGQPVCDDHGRPIFWVVDEDGQLRRLVFLIQPEDRDPADRHPEGRPFGEGDGPPDDLPAPLKIKPAPGQRRPPQTPAGTWDDDDLRAKVEAIVGKDRRDREGADFAAVCRLVGRKPTPKQKQRLRKLVFGGTTASGKRVLGERPSVIAREIKAMRHSLTYPAVRDMQAALHKPVAQDVTALVLKYEAELPLLDEDGKRVALDENGKLVTGKDGPPVLVRPPVCDEDGRPILWVPDEHGQPSRPYGVLDEHGDVEPYIAGEPRPRRRGKFVRPPVEKMIFR